MLVGFSFFLLDYREMSKMAYQWRLKRVWCWLGGWILTRGCFRFEKDWMLTVHCPSQFLVVKLVFLFPFFLLSFRLTAAGFAEEVGTSSRQVRDAWLWNLKTRIFYSERRPDQDKCVNHDLLDSWFRSRSEWPSIGTRMGSDNHRPESGTTFSCTVGVKSSTTPSSTYWRWTRQLLHNTVSLWCNVRI